jgi:DNA-binding MarR family transcriptional regulator
MFYLPDLPTDRTMDELSRRYNNINPSAIKICAALLRTGSEMLTAFESIFSRYGLSHGRFLTLIVMNRTPAKEVNPSYLAKKVGVKRATMTGLLNGLEKGGFIERLTEPEDRRKVRVRLTDQGCHLLNQVLPGYYRQIAKTMSKLTEKERQDLMSLLQKVNQGLSSLHRR